MNHIAIRLVIALALGLGLAIYAYERVTDPRPALQRQQEERAVLAAREILRSYVGDAGELRIVDPLAPDRSAGKVYIYPAEPGWDVSGYYRRGETDEWHPFLMRLDARLQLVTLAVDDVVLQPKAMHDPKVTAVPPSEK